MSQSFQLASDYIVGQNVLVQVDGLPTRPGSTASARARPAGDREFDRDADLPASSPDKDERTVWLGADSTGWVLEVVTVPSDKGGVYVIHAQDIRARFRRYYDAAVADE